MFTYQSVPSGTQPVNDGKKICCFVNQVLDYIFIGFILVTFTTYHEKYIMSRFLF